MVRVGDWWSNSRSKGIINIHIAFITYLMPFLTTGQKPGSPLSRPQWLRSPSTLADASGCFCLWAESAMVGAVNAAWPLGGTYTAHRKGREVLKSDRAAQRWNRRQSLKRWTDGTRVGWYEYRFLCPYSSLCSHLCPAGSRSIRLSQTVWHVGSKPTAGF